MARVIDKTQITLDALRGLHSAYLAAATEKNTASSAMQELRTFLNKEAIKLIEELTETSNKYLVRGVYTRRLPKLWQNSPFRGNVAFVAFLTKRQTPAAPNIAASVP